MSRGVYSSWTGLDEVVMNGDRRSPMRAAACWRVVSSQLSNACRSSSNCWRSNMPLSGGRGRDYPAALIESVKEGRGIIARRFLAPAPAVLVRQWRVPVRTASGAAAQRAQEAAHAGHHRLALSQDAVGQRAGARQPNFRFFLSQFVELDQPPVRALGMDEGDLLPAGADHRLPVDQMNSVIGQPRQTGFQIGHFEADVVDSGTASFEEAGHTAAGRTGFDQLDLRVAGGQEGHDGFLVGDILDVGDFEAEAVAPEAEGGRDIVDDDGNVIDANDVAHLVLKLTSSPRARSSRGALQGPSMGSLDGIRPRLRAARCRSRPGSRRLRRPRRRGPPGFRRTRPQGAYGRADSPPWRRRAGRAGSPACGVALP